MGLPQADERACLGCYKLWYPERQLFTFQEFCEKYNKDQVFKKKVKSGFADQDVGGRSHASESITKTTRLGVKVRSDGLSFVLPVGSRW